MFGDLNGVDNGWNYQGKFGHTFTGIEVAATDSTTADGLPNNPNDRITGIESFPYSVTWSMSQEQMVVNQFMPPDAKYVSTKTVYFIGNVVSGIEKTYTSVLLGRTLPKADFLDANEKQAQPGRFYVFLSPTYSEQGSELCAIGTDEKLVLMGL